MEVTLPPKGRDLRLDLFRGLGGSITDSCRRARSSRARSRPNLPVQQSTKVELIVNLKTAKALGLTVPPVAPRSLT
jgi:hypothetical protein